MELADHSSCDWKDLFAFFANPQSKMTISRNYARLKRGKIIVFAHGHLSQMELTAHDAKKGIVANSPIDLSAIDLSSL